MKIDTHQHFWRYEAQDLPWIDGSMSALQRDCMPQDCEVALRACGVGATVAVQARSGVAETDFLLALTQKNPYIVGVVGWVDLAAEDIGLQLDRWSDHAALRGFRHILQDEADISAVLDLPAFNRGVGQLQQRKLVYDVLVFEHQLLAVLQFCAHHDRHWLVLDHVGKPALRNLSPNQALPQAWLAALHALGRMPHVACKLSGLVTEAAWQGAAGMPIAGADARTILRVFDVALETFGPKRIMFGSDWPVCQLAAPYETVYALAQEWADASLSVDAQADFWSGNAIRCYGLNTQALPA